MSLAKVKEAADAHTETYVSVPADVLAKALADSGEKPTPGSFAEHVAQVCDRAARQAKATGIEADYPVMSVHRERHLGKLLGAESPES